MVTDRVVEEGDVVFAGQKVRVDVERELGWKSEEGEWLDCDVLAREGAVGAIAPALVFECQERRAEVGATELIDPGQEPADLGEGGIDALLEVGDAPAVEREAALLHRRVGVNVDGRDEVGPRNVLDEQEELLGAVYVDLFMEGARQTCIFKGRGVDMWRELVIEGLELELQLCGVGDIEPLRRGNLAEVGRD